ncbi:Aste57867_12573 [Aphanomyces stellatus]|uniref:Aste57867_12573 protein n=1 Tax=Aphanomyces stellatus TaxID=120398 RepID=A0A485KVZ5_9STRA|nr:hypothetical protein As57867_012527 [Aphanomyces stellatus]VFT89424.1 Aste57867_12573 [Aphanomyces stellatus]
MTDAKRLYECERKRRYRAKQSHEREFLLSEVFRLKGELNWHLANSTRQHQLAKQEQLWRERAHRAFQDRSTSTTQNQTLREQVRRHRQLLSTLVQWVGASIQPEVKEGRTWLHSTLLADPTARQYGYRWLTDCIFHSAVEAAALDGNINDIATNDVLVDPDWEIRGSHTTHQTTYFTHYATVASCLWRSFTENPHMVNYDTERVVSDGGLLYLRMQAKKKGSPSACLLMRRYELPTRIVFVRLFLRHDECYPFGTDEVRTHGVGWTTIEKVTDNITLYRAKLMQYVPATQDGDLPFDQLAASFKVEPHAARHVVVARIESQAQRAFADQIEARKRDLVRRLDELQQYERKL